MIVPVPLVMVNPPSVASVVVTLTPLSMMIFLPLRLPLKVCVAVKSAVKFVMLLVMVARSAAASAAPIVTTNACPDSLPSWFMVAPVILL